MNPEPEKTHPSHPDYKCPEGCKLIWSKKHGRWYCIPDLEKYRAIYGKDADI